MATATVTQNVTHTFTVTSGTPTPTSRAPAQAGILEHGNPSIYDPKNPLTTFIIQAGIIILFCRLLYYPLAKIRQPRVIAEVIGGILLGPSVMGRIPGFSNAIFPAASLPVLTMAANLGLVLFLFLVGLEVDVRFLVSNARIALAVGTLGMALPFGLGVAIAYGLYNEFGSEPGTVPIGFGVFLIFVGIAMAITAFPVLCRILTELKLLNTPVGIIALSAGVGNDVVGWILLALCVALVNAGSGITALWVLLAAAGYVLLLVFVVRPIFVWYLRRTGSLQSGPTQSVMVATMLLVLVSAFFTSVIGIHPIFGGFLAGIILPHEGGFAVKVTEKIEDLVSVIFLPLYFALSGLNTNLGLLNNGMTWAYLIALIVIAFVTKVVGGTLAAKSMGLVWRESLTIGVLMSCKGLVELIVLNIGLQAKILSTRTFTMFVVMALVVTFITTPLVRWLYPQWYHTKLAAWKRGEIDWETNRRLDSNENEPKKESEIRKILAYLRLDSMAGAMSIVSLLAQPAAEPGPRLHPSKGSSGGQIADKDETDDENAAVDIPKRPLQVYGVRLTELTERESSVMRVSEIDEYSTRDPVVNAFRTFGQLKNVAVAGQLAIVSEPNFAAALTERASDASADLLLVPWSATGATQDTVGSLNSAAQRFASGAFSQFVLRAVEKAPCPSAVFVDRGSESRQRRGHNTDPGHSALKRTVSALSARSAWTTPAMLASVPKGHHILLPYFSTSDDATALRMVMQMASNELVTATIVLYKSELAESPSLPSDEPAGGPVSPTENSSQHPDATSTIRSRAIPNSENQALFRKYATSMNANVAKRLLFVTAQSSDSDAQDFLARVREEFDSSKRGATELVVLGRNLGMRREGNSTMDADAKSWAASDAGQALGAIAGSIIREVDRVSVLVVQAN